MTTRKDESGAALVELALLLPVFVLMFVGIVNYAILIEQRVQLQEAAAAGAAYATIPGNQTNIAAMKAVAVASAPQFNTTMAVTAADVYSCSPGGAVVTAVTVCPGGGGPLLFVQVTTSATEYPVLRYLGMPTSMTMQGFASYEVVP